MNNYIIVTNNHKVMSTYKECIFVDGEYRDVLIKVRDLVHVGFKLISHPLPASSRMFLSPVRSLILQKSNCQKSNEVIDLSIQKYDKTLGKRDPDIKNIEEYKLIDYSLLISAFEEIERLGVGV